MRSLAFLTLLLIPCFVRAQQMAFPGISPVKLEKAMSGMLDEPTRKRLHDQVLLLFGKQNLLKGKASPRIEGTTVAWATMGMGKARVVRGDGTLMGEMTSLGEDGLQVLVTRFANFTDFQYQIMLESVPQVAGSVRLEHYSYTADSERHQGVPVGHLKTFEWNHSRIFPDTQRTVTVYLPQQLTPGEEACLMVWQDGGRHVDPSGSMRVSVVLDNLIHQKQMPVTVGVFVDPGRKSGQQAGGKASNRSLEYDSLGDAYVRFLAEEILPEVQKRYGVKFRPEPEARAIAGGSSGGICAFTAAWERPQMFHKVLCWVGTFVDIRGGNQYPYLIRVTERKPLRVYLLDGSNDLDNKFGNWPLANRMMEASLRYMGYDYRMDWTECFHGSKGMAPSLPEALRWLWRGVQ